MHFKPKKKGLEEKFQVKIGSKEVKEVKSCRFLGVIVDNELKWKEHISHICNKVAKSIGILSKLRKVVTSKTLKNMYYTFVYTYIIYCNLLWGNTKKAYIDPLYKLQKKAIRILCNIRRRDETSVFFKNEQIIKVIDMYRYQTVLFMYRIREKTLPEIYQEKWYNNMV